MGGMIWARAHLGPGPLGPWAHLGPGPLGPWPTWALAQVVTRHRGFKATMYLYTIFQIGQIIPPRWDDLAPAGMISSHLWQSSQLVQSYVPKRNYPRFPPRSYRLMSVCMVFHLSCDCRECLSPCAEVRARAKLFCIFTEACPYLSGHCHMV